MHLFVIYLTFAGGSIHLPVLQLAWEPVDVRQGFCVPRSLQHLEIPAGHASKHDQPAHTG